MANSWMVSLALLIGGIAGAAGPLGSLALAQQPFSPTKPSWTSSISSGFKRGFDKLGNALNPKKSDRKPAPEDDAVSLQGTGKPGPELFVAVARLSEQRGKLGEAEQQYVSALKLKSDYLPALLGYAQLKERLGLSDDALRLYQRAAKLYPKDASVHNNMGMCFARQDRFDEAADAMSAAVQLEPKNPLYRNNFATVLIEQGKLREAFAQLRETHREAAAYYNMGYLLNKKGQTLAATQHFALALRADPSMTAAQQWIEYLQKRTTQARLPKHPAAGGLRITSGETPAPMPAEEPMPHRLPPTAAREADIAEPTLPGITYQQRAEPSTAPTAPLPTPAQDSEIRPLPLVY